MSERIDYVTSGNYPMPKPKTVRQASEAYEKAARERARAAKRAAEGLSPPESKPSGNEERKYQKVLEEKGQLRLFPGAY